MIRTYLSSIGRELRILGGDGRGSVLLAIAAGWGLTIGGRTIYPVLLPHLRTAYGFDLATAGLLLAILFLAYSVGQLPGGFLADRIGERTTLTASVALSGGALALIVVARESAALFVATAVFGFAVGFYAIARFTAIASIYPDRFGTAIGVTNAAPELGQAIVPPIAGVVAVSIGWQYGFGFAIPLFAIVAITLWIVVPGGARTEPSPIDTVSFATVRYVGSALRNRQIVVGTTVLILGISIWQAFTGFYPTYLIEEKGISPPIASVLFGIYFASTAIVHPISGVIYDRWNVRYTFSVVAVSVVAFASLPFVERLWQLVAVSVLLGSFMGFETSTESYLVNALPSDVEGTGFGILRTLVFATGATSPILFGAIADRGFFDELFLLLAALGVGMLAVATQLPVSESG
ncbi:MAG: MFS transporter [Halobacteriota archaeon]